MTAGIIKRYSDKFFFPDKIFFFEILFFFKRRDLIIRLSSCEKF